MPPIELTTGKADRDSANAPNKCAQLVRSGSLRDSGVRRDRAHPTKILEPPRVIPGGSIDLIDFYAAASTPRPYRPVTKTRWYRTG